ncbi:MAG: hypothetical protein Q4B28_04630 [bacterium]|nr:hypothetical protein [bacterium]
MISEITRSGSRINKQRAYIITAIYQNYTFISEECFFEVGNYLGV